MSNNTTSNRHRRSSATKSTSNRTAGHLSDKSGGGGRGDANFPDGGGDPEVWTAFSNNFRQVQSVLDHNRLLIQQVNENHQSKIHDNMVKNVALIQEINGNISKVVSLYANLSSDFMSAAAHNRSADKSNSESEEK